MLAIRLHGRGGQGAQVGCQILADAFFRTGAWVQAFAAYGGERRGAPVVASLRVADRPIRLRCDVVRPDHLLILDATLLEDLRAEAAAAAGVVVINAPGPPAGLPAGARAVAVDGAAIARRTGLGAVVAPVLLGAFAAASGLLSLETLTAAVEARSPAKIAENRRACVLGYEAATRRAGPVPADAA
jgi:pyruvate ferredoxin oxidoreductase gamma subunit